MRLSPFAVDEQIRKLFSRIRAAHVSKGSSCTPYNTKLLVGEDIEPLSEDEKRAIIKTWGKYARLKTSEYAFRLYKHFEGFDPKFCSDDMLFPWISVPLEDNVFESALKHKAIYSIYFPDIPQPKNYGKCINGVFYDCDMNVVSRDILINVLAELPEFIIKPTFETHSGWGVKKISHADATQLQTLINSYNGNFVCQEIIQQHPKLAALHQQSVNSLRIVTLFLNGKASVCHSTVRIGQGDAITDNLTGDTGAVIVGFDEEGNFRDYGYKSTPLCKTYESGYGVTFKGYQIPEIKKVLEAAQRFHAKYLPTQGYVAWDWSINVNGDPILIEINLGDWAHYPSIFYFQMAYGKPIFGERTKEVLDYIQNHDYRFYDAKYWITK